MGPRSADQHTRADDQEATLSNEFGQPIGPSVEIDAQLSAPSAEPMVGRWCRVEALDARRHGPAMFDAYDQAVDARGWTYLSVGPFDTAASLIEWLVSIEASTDPSYFVVSDEAGPCGIAAYMRIAPSAGSVEVGSIHFAPRLQRSAAATEAMYLMMRRAFEAGYRRYEWKCDSLNAGSRVAAERFGFTYEGDFRQAIVYKGRSRDTSWFSIIDGEWVERRAEFERWLDPANFDDAGRQRTKLRH